MIAVSANAQGRSPGEVTADAMKLAQRDRLPAGLRRSSWAAPRATRRKCSARWRIALVMGVALMYLILVMQFGSFTAPLAVMLSLPLSLIGVVLALLLTRRHAQPDELHRRHHADGPGGQERDPAAGRRAQARRREGMDREEALMAAGRKRLRPILMTTFALIAGMMPVAIGLGEGGEFYRPMAVAIIGGTITSTAAHAAGGADASTTASRSRATARWPSSRRGSSAGTRRWPSCVTLLEASGDAADAAHAVARARAGLGRAAARRRRRGQAPGVIWRHEPPAPFAGPAPYLEWHAPPHCKERPHAFSTPGSGRRDRCRCRRPRCGSSRSTPTAASTTPSTSSYITLADVKQMVLAGEDFEVRDAKTGEDLTRSILLQIILEEESGGVPMFSTQMLAQIIRFYGHAMQGMMGTMLEKNLQTFVELQNQFLSQSKGLYDPKHLSPEVWTQFLSGQAPQLQSLMGGYVEQSREMFEQAAAAPARCSRACRASRRPRSSAAGGRRARCPRIAP